MKNRLLALLSALALSVGLALAQSAVLLKAVDSSGNIHPVQCDSNGNLISNNLNANITVLPTPLGGYASDQGVRAIQTSVAALGTAIANAQVAATTTPISVQEAYAIQTAIAAQATVVAAVATTGPGASMPAAVQTAIAAQATAIAFQATQVPTQAINTTQAAFLNNYPVAVATWNITPSASNTNYFVTIGSGVTQLYGCGYTVVEVGPTPGTNPFGGGISVSCNTTIPSYLGDFGSEHNFSNVLNNSNISGATSGGWGSATAGGVNAPTGALAFVFNTAGCTPTPGAFLKIYVWYWNTRGAFYRELLFKNGIYLVEKRTTTYDGVPSPWSYPVLVDKSKWAFWRSIKDIFVPQG
jgi:hypothetical protein